MTTPTNENRENDRETERIGPEPRPRLDLSVTKIAAGATAAALAAAVGSKLGVAGTIVGAAVASVVATSASALIGHSIERGKTAARKAMPVLDAEPHRTSDAPTAVLRLDETQVLPPLADRAVADSALDETVLLDGKTGPYAQTVVLPKIGPDAPGAPDAPDASGAPRTWKDRLPGRKPLLAAALASFVIGTGAVTALEVARKGEFPGYHGNVFDPGQGGGSTNQPAPQYPDGSGTHEGTTPSQKPDSSPTTPGSDSGSETPSTGSSTPPTSGTTPSGPTTPSTGPTTGPTSPSTSPSTPPTSSTGPTTAPSTSGATTPSAPATATGAVKATPSGGASGA